ncbi:hypothetical protein ACFL04_01830 [Patescibacteria group bacterium]
MELSHAEKEKQVFQFFNDVIIREINVVHLRDPKGNDAIPLRVQTVLTFSLLDILASYWFEFQDLQDTPKNRFQRWYDVFCKTDNNEEYKRGSDWKNVSSARLYNLRSSLVHFFGLSQESEGTYFSLVSNELPEKDRKELSKLTNKHGKKTVVFRPRDFHKLISSGGVLMLESWQSMIQEANRGDEEKKKNYIDGINRIWSKIQLEGAVMVYKEK